MTTPAQAQNPWLPDVTTSTNTKFASAEIGNKIGELFGQDAKADWDSAMGHSTLVELERGNNMPPGRSDSDTIGIDTDKMTIEEAAVIGAHEARHSNRAHAAASGAANQSDPHTNDPLCGKCNHADDFKSDHQAIASADCETPGGGLQKMCELAEKMRRAIDQLIDDCKDDGCPSHQVPAGSTSLQPLCSCPHS